MNMYPNWLMVLYAKTRLKSYCAMPMVAEKMAVNPPTHATVASASGCNVNSG